MIATVLSIGDELILGQTTDTNCAWISKQLAAVGCPVDSHITVADDQAAIERVMRQSVASSDFLIVSGGIGPTQDDLTRQALAAIMGVPLEPSSFWLKKLEDFFVKRGRPMPEMNKIQAMIPRGAALIDNTAGTAAGVDATVGVSPGRPGGCRVFLMPGVPREMKIMFQRDVLPHVAQAGGGAAIVSRTLHTFGLGESTVAERLGELMTRGRNPSVGTTVSGGIVSLRLNSRFGSRDQATEMLQQTEAACRAALGDLIFGSDEQTLGDVVADLLLAQSPRPMLAVADVFSGGGLTQMLTQNSLAEACVAQAWMASSAGALGGTLGVDIRVQGLDDQAAILAAAARRAAAVDIGLAITGQIDEPSASTLTSTPSPGGQACVALASTQGTLSRSFNFPGDRLFVRDRAVKMMLTLLRSHLLRRPLPF